MNEFLRQTPELQAMFNCSFYSVDEIPLKERRHPVTGVALLVMATLAELLYAPCVWAMWRRENRRESCYKLMLLLGVLDMANIIVSGFLTGYFAAVGAVYCTYPNFMYLAGMFGLGVWGAESLASVLLAVNRCVSVWNSIAAERLFNGKIIYIWISLPLLYMTSFFFFSWPPVYSSILVGWFFNPHVVYYDNLTDRYGSIMHTIHNSTLGPILFGIYAIFFALISKRSHRITGGEQYSDSSRRRKNRSTFVQVLLIGVMHMFACVTYIYMQFNPGRLITLLASYGWLLVQGTTPIIYLSMNANIRNTIKRGIRCFDDSCNGSRSKIPDHSVNNTRLFFRSSRCTTIG